MATSLDHIVSLSVAVAEAPGATAVLVGSGVSRDAGIPTGWEIMREGLRRLMQLEWTGADPAPTSISDEELDAWLEATGRNHIDYPQLLELIAPDATTRRAYLAAFFEDKQPGRSHELLAELAHRRLVKVFITSNFDRLLERALEARGIQPTVVASDADLSDAEPREHARCFVLKAHGDYLRLTIRNTPDELDRLPPGLTAELHEIFSRHHLLVLGYSGQDPAIVRELEAGSSRYGLWWLARGEPLAQTGDLLRRLNARVIRRSGAGEFLAELERRLQIFEQHPTGLTPAVVHDETTALIRSRDEVGLGELLRRERQHYEQSLDKDRENSNRQPTKEVIVEVWRRQRPAWQRRLASLLPLGLYDPERFGAEVQRMADDLGRQPPRGGHSLWVDLGQVGAAVIGYQLGATLIETERFAALASLLQASWSNLNNYSERLVDLMGNPEHAFGEALAPPVNTSWLSPTWKWLTTTLDETEWFAERYPEVTRSVEESMAHFDLVVAIFRGLNSEGTGAWFTLGPEIERFARVLRGSARLQAGVAEAVGLDAENFISKAADALGKAHGWSGQFTNANHIASILADDR